MKITIINQPLDNRGDESANKALIKYIKSRFEEPEIRLIHFDQREESINGFNFDDKIVHYNVKTFFGHFRFYRFLIKKKLSNKPIFFKFFYKRFFDVISDSDLVFCAPGGVCLGPYFNWSHLWGIRQVISLNKKLIYFARSLGPFHQVNQKQRLYNTEACDVLSSAYFISIRDSFSSKVCNDLNLKFSETIDSAFLNDYQDEYVQDDIFKIIGADDYVVFVPNQLTWNFNYPQMDEGVLAKYYKGIFTILSKKAIDTKIVMLPQLFNHGAYNDINYFKRLSKNIDNVVIVDDVYSSDSQQKVISKAKFLIGARYHSIIFSINNETPFIALAYEKKINGLLEKLNLSDFLIDFSFLNEKNVEKRDQIMSENLEKISNNLDQYLNDANSFPHKKSIARKIAINSANQLVIK